MGTGKVGILTEEMKKAIARSGYLLEQRLVPLIESRGYKATPNHRFRDPQTGAVSELDIHAITAKRFSRQDDFFFPILLIECKNLRCPLVFFTQREIRLRYFLGDPHISGLPCKVFRRNRPVDLMELLGLEEFHHYYTRARIASQFCAVFPKKGGGKNGSRASSSEDYTAGHKIGEIDLYSDGIAKLVRALQVERREHAETFRNDRQFKGVYLQFYYPILVTGGSLYECFVAGGRNPRYKRVHRIGLIHRRAEEGTTVDDRLDVVDIVGFRDLLKIIEEETERVKRILQMRRRALEEATRRISGRLLRMGVRKRLAVIAGEKDLERP